MDKRVVFVVVLMCNVVLATAQKSAKIVFYNCENFFDAEDDSLSLGDNDFLPDGNYHWSFSRFYAKNNAIGRVLVAIGGWEPPLLVGLAEIENANVLDNLTKRSPASGYKLKYLHRNSPDKRCIDVGLLYNPKRFAVLDSQWLSVSIPTEGFFTRDILYAKGIVDGVDTLHVFVNHWPSRYSGSASSEPLRMHAASVLKGVADSIWNTDNGANILAMGDFNDYPADKSISTVLGVVNDSCGRNPIALVNLVSFAKGSIHGSHKNAGEWGYLDQMFVSSSFFGSAPKLKFVSFGSFFADWLLVPDEAYAGRKNFRTFLGMKYQGGYSDHLPVVGEFLINK